MILSLNLCRLMGDWLLGVRAWLYILLGAWLVDFCYIRGCVIAYDLLCCLMNSDDSIRQISEVISLAKELDHAERLRRSKTRRNRDGGLRGEGESCFFKAV